MPEVEAKFLVRDPNQLNELVEVLRSLGYTLEPHRNETILDRYFDTPDWRILQAGWAFRCRDRSGERSLTLKALSLSEGPIQVREEVEQRIRVPHTRLGDLPSGPVRDRLAAILNGVRAEELFVIRNQRLLYRLVTPEDHTTHIELAIDQAQIIAEKVTKTAPGTLNFTELELELKQGQHQTLEQLADKLASRVDVLPARLSKFQRGLQTAGLATPPDTDVEPDPPLSLTDPLIRLGYHRLRQQLHLLKLQQPRAWEGLDLEGVHQMRVATRRIRAALRVFSAVLPERATATFNTEFRWLARALGEVRDLDVYRDNLRHYMGAMPADDAEMLLPYESYLAMEWRKARRKLIAVLSSRRYARLVERFDTFLQRGPSRALSRQFGSLTVQDAAAQYVDRLVKRVRKRGRAIDSNSPPELLHALRIRCKRLRYLLEFFRDFYADRLKGCIDATKRLQDALGEHHDAWVASARLRRYAQTVSLRNRERGLLLALGQLIHTQDQHATAYRERYDKEWRRFERGISRKRLRAVLQTAH